MALPLRDYVSQVLAECNRASKIYIAVHEAWRQSIEAYPERGRYVRKSTFRGLVWEAAVRELERIGVEDRDFYTLFHCDTASFIMENAVLFRFKHADQALTTTNVQTAEAMSFDDHEVDLYGFKGVQRIELCYVLDEFETSIAWVGFAARSKGRFLWKLELALDGIAQPENLDLFEDESDTAKLVKFKEPGRIQKNEKKDPG